MSLDRHRTDLDPAETPKTPTDPNIQPNVGAVYNDLGFGTRVVSPRERLIRKDGVFTAIRRGLPFWQSFNPYHTLIRMGWGTFFLLIFLAYVVLNVLFAEVYMLIGVENLSDIRVTGAGARFMEAFFFSCQTFTTVGYGRVNPTGLGANLVASFESMTGLLSFALATGILYGRFAKPVAKLKYAEKALIAPYRDITAFMFRVANALSNQLIEVECTVMLTYQEPQQDGTVKRVYYPLPLERNKVNLLPSVWIVVHPIEEDSPLRHMTAKSLEDVDAEFIVMFKAFDDSFSNVVYTRNSYKYDEIVWGGKYKSVLNGVAGSAPIVQLDWLSHYDPAELPKL